MSQKPPRILLLARDGDAAQACIQKLQGHRCHQVSSWGDFLAELKRLPYHGILVELSTKMRLRREQRHQLQAITEQYVTAHVRYDPDSESLRLLFTGKAGSPKSLKSFISAASNTAGRQLRRAERAPLHLNVTVAEAPDGLTGDAFKTTTLGISNGGCFLIHTSPWQPETRLWLRILEFTDSTPVEAEVTWCRPWGAAMEVPGAGLRFVGLTPDQALNLEQLLLSR